MLVILCDCSANILLGLGANGSYEFLMTLIQRLRTRPHMKSFLTHAVRGCSLRYYFKSIVLIILMAFSTLSEMLTLSAAHGTFGRASGRGA